MLHKIYSQRVTLPAGTVGSDVINMPSDAREIVSISVNTNNVGLLTFQIDNDVILDAVRANNLSTFIPNTLQFTINQPCSNSSNFILKYDCTDEQDTDVVTVNFVYRCERSRHTPKRMKGLDIPVLNGTQVNRIRFNAPIRKIVFMYSRLLANDTFINLTVNNDVVQRNVEGQVFQNTTNGAVYVGKPVSSVDNVFVEQSGNQGQAFAQIVFTYE